MQSGVQRIYLIVIGVTFRDYCMGAFLPSGVHWLERDVQRQAIYAILSISVELRYRNTKRDSLQTNDFPFQNLQSGSANDIFRYEVQRTAFIVRTPKTPRGPFRVMRLQR